VRSNGLPVELSSMSTQSSAHVIVKAQTMEYLKNLHEQLFQVTPENVEKEHEANILRDCLRLSVFKKELLVKTDAKFSGDGKSINDRPKLD